MLQLKNTTPLPASVAVFPDQRGVDTVCAVIKGSFTMRPVVALAEKQLPVAVGDEYHGDPVSSSLKQAGEVHLAKPSTDVLVLGHAWAPQGRPVPQSAVRVVVAERHKTAAIFGDRMWRRGGGLSAPEPFEKIPLIYERAYGGSHQPDPQGPRFSEEGNPVGRGFAGRRSPGDLVNTPAPNIEDPNALMQSLGDAPTPVGFGAIAPSWQARRAFAGTYDASWQRRRAPYLPNDFNPKFFNVASSGFVFDRFLSGGERVQLLGFSPEGPFDFALPRLDLKITFSVAGRNESPPVNLDTIAFHTDEGVVSLTWRCVLACDKEVLKVQAIHVHAVGLEALAPPVGAAAT